MWKRLQIQSFLHSRHNKNHQTCFCVIKPIKRSSIILFVHKNVSAGTNVDTVLLLTHALLQSNHWSYTSATPHLFYQRSIFFFYPHTKVHIYCISRACERPNTHTQFDLSELFDVCSWRRMKLFLCEGERKGRRIRLPPTRHVLSVELMSFSSKASKHTGVTMRVCVC